MKKEKDYYFRLDIIRILSCILVLLYHLNIIKGGYLAVCTFFVLTGYLECKNLLKKKEISLKDYYKNRFKKIYIPLLIVVCLTVILSKLVFGINWLNLKQESISSLLGYNNFWQLKTNLDYFTKNINSPFIHLWYIAILLQFDLLFPLFFIGIKKLNEKVKHNLSYIVLTLITFGTTIYLYISSIQNPIMNVYYNTIARSFSILFGIFLAYVHEKKTIPLPEICKRFNREIFIIYGVAFTALCIFISDEDPLYALFMIIVTLISCRLITYATLKESKENKIMSNISKSTYEIYLVQYPILYFMQNTTINPTIKQILILILTITVGMIIHIIINKKTNIIILKYIRLLLLGTITLLGLYLIITEEDHTKEMKVLEDKLNENLILMKEKNKEYKNIMNNEEKEWNNILEKLDQDEETVVKEELNNLPVVGIGDSVFLNAVGSLYEKFPNGYFNGEVSRSVYGGARVINELENSGSLSNTVVLALATNTAYSENRVNIVIEPLGDRDIYWVNAVGGDDVYFNSEFEKYAKNHPNIHIVDWVEASKGHPEFFYADGIHPRNAGVDAYVNAIYDTIYKVHLERYREKKNEILKQKEEEDKKKITFYGNDALINSYESLQKKYENALFNAKEYDYKTLYQEIKEKKQNNTLEYKIVFIFDKNFKITEEEYQKLIKLCKDHEIYLINLTEKDYSKLKDVKVMNLYQELNKDENTFMADKTHLTEKGNNILVSKIEEELKK